MYGSVENNEERSPPSSHGSSSSSSSSSTEEDPPPVTILDHAKRILSQAFSYALTFYAIFSITITATAFVGRSIGSHAMSGLGLAICFVNFLGFSTVTGLVMGLDTLLPQAVGMSKTHPLISTYVQQTGAVGLMWICGITVIFVCAPYFLPHILAAADERVAHLAGRAVRLSAATLPFYLIEEILQSYLGCLLRTCEILSGALSSAVLVNPLLLYLFVTRDWIGFDGAIVAWTLTEVMMCVSTIVIANRRGAFDKTWRGFDLSIICGCSNFGPLLRVGFPAMFMMFAEWSAFEVNGFAAARILPATQFSAQVVLQQVATFLFPMVVGIGIAVNILVGNDIGAGRTACAIRCAWVGLLLILCEFALTAVVIFVFRRDIASVFSTEQAVVDCIVDTIPYEYLSHCCDSLFCLVGSIIRAHGHQKTGVAIAVVGYYLVGLPLGWVMAITNIFFSDEKDKIKGLWIGPSCGQFVAFVMGAIFLTRISWEQTDQMAEDLRIDESEAEEE